MLHGPQAWKHLRLSSVNCEQFDLFVHVHADHVYVHGMCTFACLQLIKETW